MGRRRGERRREGANERGSASEDLARAPRTCVWKSAHCAPTTGAAPAACARSSERGGSKHRASDAEAAGNDDEGGDELTPIRAAHASRKAHTTAGSDATCDAGSRGA
jgi:hypothetical protein